MISPSQVDEVRQYLAEKRFSQREIARLTGLSRGTVGAIASGKRRDRPDEPLGSWHEPLGPVIRCPGCGGRVYAPCRLCNVRARLEAKSDRPRHSPNRPTSMGRMNSAHRDGRTPNESSIW